MKDHEINQAIKELCEIATKYHGAQQMREHIAGVVLRIRDSFREKMQLTVKEDRQLRDDLIEVLRKNGFVYKKRTNKGGHSKWRSPAGENPHLWGERPEWHAPIRAYGYLWGDNRLVMPSRKCNDPCAVPGVITGNYDYRSTGPTAPFRLFTGDN